VAEAEADDPGDEAFDFVMTELSVLWLSGRRLLLESSFLILEVEATGRLTVAGRQLMPLGKKGTKNWS